MFHDEVANFIPPSARQGQLLRLLHAIDQAELGVRTDFQKPFAELQQFLRRRGVTVVISDFYHAPRTLAQTMEPLRFRGNEVILFHVWDPQEVRLALGGPALLQDMETGASLEVSPEYARSQFAAKAAAHMEALQREAEGAGLDYCMLSTDRPLDAALREYLTVRQGRL